jgi:hypothetical protein
MTRLSGRARAPLNTASPSYLDPLTAVRMKAQTRLVMFEETGETIQVRIKHWLPPRPSHDMSSARCFYPPEPNWREVLPNHEVTPVVGGYHARRRR